MQLVHKRTGKLTRSLGLLTAALFAATNATAQTQVSGDAGPDTSQSLNHAVADGPDTIRVDSAILFYQESGSRVRAIEPVINVTDNRANGDVFTMKLTADTLTGATPNGAAPWIAPQTFITPTNTSVSSTSTSASGHSVVTTVNGIATRTYVAPPNTTPLDYGFQDQRLAIDLGYATSIGAKSHISGGGGFSKENDYQSISGNIGISQDFNDKNTTASLSLNAEFDQSRPYYGTPTPFTPMSAKMGGPGESKTVLGVVAGLTQVMNRHWLAQLSFSYSNNQGYQTDPYRILSVVDAVTGGPLEYLYEGRPTSRNRQSLYFGNKIAIGETVAGLSVRGYHDSWGITSFTGEISERVPLGPWAFIEPNFRYYTQSAADFFVNYLVAGTPLPQYASSDSRLGKFNAATVAVKAGYQPFDNMGELYVNIAYYKQSGDSHPADAIGALKTQDLFSGVNAASVVLGYSFAF